MGNDQLFYSYWICSLLHYKSLAKRPHHDSANFRISKQKLQIPAIILLPACNAKKYYSFISLLSLLEDEYYFQKKNYYLPSQDIYQNTI